MVETLIEAITNNPEIFAILLAIVADFGAGALPDRYIPYIGILRRVIKMIMKNKGAKMSLILVLLVSVMGCAHMEKSSVCDTEQESLICDKIPQPENADILLQLANVQMLKEEAYSAEDALNFLDMCESFLSEETVTYAGMVRWLSTKMEDYSLEIFVLSGYVETLQIPQTLTDFDRNLLLSHIEHQRNLIKAYMESE